MSETPQRHGHTGPGDGGLLNIPLGSTTENETNTANSQTNLDITTFGTENVYILQFQTLQPANDNEELHLLTSTDGGSTFNTGASDYAWGYRNVGVSGTGADSGSNGDAKVQLTDPEIGNASNESANGTILFHNPTDSNFLTAIQYDISYFDSGGGVVRVMGAGQRTTAEANDAVRLTFSSGNIASGDAQLYELSG